ncbi:MAG: FkbM family methyltransferase [Rhodospirillales bacterium]|nr:FkbM family methyltransferase [Rhodospirillales bacterium]
MNRPFETRQINTIKDLTTKNQSALFIDCGANFGLYTVLLGCYFPDIHIHSFEPVRGIFEKLETNIKLNHLEGRTTRHNVGVSDTETSATINVNPASYGISSLIRNDDRHTYTSSENIHLVTLDNALKIKNQNITLKIDIEGHELSALEGMTDILRENRCVIQIETRQETLTEVKAFLERVGYQLIETIDDDLYFMNAL